VGAATAQGTVSEAASEAATAAEPEAAAQPTSQATAPAKHLAAGRHAEARPLLVAALDLAVAQAHEDPERELRALLAELGN
jgi:hypothetical protein